HTKYSRRQPDSRVSCKFVKRRLRGCCNFAKHIGHASVGPRTYQGPPRRRGNSTCVSSAGNKHQPIAFIDIGRNYYIVRGCFELRCVEGTFNGVIRCWCWWVVWRYTYLHRTAIARVRVLIRYSYVTGSSGSVLGGLSYKNRLKRARVV